MLLPICLMPLLLCLIHAEHGHAAPAGSTPDPAAVRKMWSPYFQPLRDAGRDRVPESGLVALGRELFFERALSPDRARSCNDCHDLAKYGSNGAAAIKAREDGTLRRDVPSVYNLADLKLLGWDGAAKDLSSRTAAALTSSAESGLADGEAVVARLEALPHYRDRFGAAFGDGAAGITFERVVKALTSFQEGLVAPAPIDDFLLGDDKALSVEQLRGAVLFDQKNCSACHTGTVIGGQMIQIAGIIKPWPNQKDLGHFEVSGDPGHKMAFRVPPLRNVAETAPYFHDHSARSLRRAIREIAISEQGLELTLEEIVSLESFLKSFTGRLPTDYIKPPAPTGERGADPTE